MPVNPVKQQGIGLKVCPVDLFDLAVGLRVELLEPAVRVAFVGVSFGQKLRCELGVVHGRLLDLSSIRHDRRFG